MGLKRDGYKTTLHCQISLNLKWGLNGQCSLTSEELGGLLSFKKLCFEKNTVFLLL
jgi:hypothetical protein